jgi:hypothetical protein
MTRKLYQDHSALFSYNYADSGDWETWQLAETLRRTAHLVNVINKLSCYAPKATPQFYEALDDEVILDLPLPAPDVLWTATSASSFKDVQSQVPHPGLTPRKVIQSANSLDQLLRAGDGQPDSSAELSRLIMACIDLDPRVTH